jgi:hypothetical protein
MRRIQVWNLGNGELSPEAIRELIPIAAGDHQGWRRHLLMSATSLCIATCLPVILPSAVPYKEILRDRNSRGPLLLQVYTIHLGREVGLPASKLQHCCGLRRIQEYMRIRALKLGQLSHPYRHLGNTGAGLAQESIRGKPGGCRLFLHILAQAHVNGIVVLGYIPVDVIQAAVPDLYVDFGSENEFEKLHECRYNGSPRAGSPSRRCASAVYRGLDTPSCRPTHTQ